MADVSGIVIAAREGSRLGTGSRMGVPIESGGTDAAERDGHAGVASTTGVRPGA